MQHRDNRDSNRKAKAEFEARASAFLLALCEGWNKRRGRTGTAGAQALSGLCDELAMKLVEWTGGECTASDFAVVLGTLCGNQILGADPTVARDHAKMNGLTAELANLFGTALFMTLRSSGAVTEQPKLVIAEA